MERNWGPAGVQLSIKFVLMNFSSPFFFGLTAGEMREVSQGTDSIDLVEYLPLLIRNAKLLRCLDGSSQLACPYFQIWQLSVLLNEIAQGMCKLGCERETESGFCSSFMYSSFSWYSNFHAQWTEAGKWETGEIKCVKSHHWGVHYIAVKYTLSHWAISLREVHNWVKKMLTMQFIKWGLWIPASREETVQSLLRCGLRCCGCSLRADTGRWSESAHGCSWGSRQSCSGCSPAPGSPKNAGPHSSPW